MIHEGQVVLLRFPQTDQAAAKLRPALVIRKLPGPHRDWLICMVSSQLTQAVPEFDEVVGSADFDFVASGLKTPSVIRISRLAVVEEEVLLGAIGEVSADRVSRIKRRLSQWIGHSEGADPHGKPSVTGAD